LEFLPDFGDRNCVELRCNLSFGPFARLKELTLLILKETLSIKPIIPEILVRNQMERTILIRSHQNISRTGPVISVGRSDRNVPFHLTKLSLVPLFYNLAYKHNNQTRGGLGQQLECTVPFQKFQSGIFLSGKCPSSLVMSI